MFGGEEDMSDGKNIGSMAPTKTEEANADATDDAFKEAMELDDNDNESEEEE